MTMTSPCELRRVAVWTFAGVMEDDDASVDVDDRKCVVSRTSDGFQFSSKGIA